MSKNAPFDTNAMPDGGGGALVIVLSSTDPGVLTFPNNTVAGCKSVGFVSVTVTPLPDSTAATGPGVGAGVDGGGVAGAGVAGAAEAVAAAVGGADDAALVGDAAALGDALTSPDRVAAVGDAMAAGDKAAATPVDVGLGCACRAAVASTDAVGDASPPVVCDGVAVPDGHAVSTSATATSADVRSSSFFILGPFPRVVVRV